MCPVYYLISKICHSLIYCNECVLEFNSFNKAYGMTSLYTRQLGDLVVKTQACCDGGPGFDPLAENPKFSKDLHQQNWLSLVPVSVLGK